MWIYYALENLGTDFQNENTLELILVFTVQQWNLKTTVFFGGSENFGPRATSWGTLIYAI